MSANQLMSKALSTASEDEAIACLMMARKKDLKIESGYTFEEVKLLVQTIEQARAERARYERAWRDRGYENQKLQVKLDNALYKRIMSIAMTAFLSSMFWLLLVIM
jgi:hypothetical protein